MSFTPLATPVSAMTSAEFGSRAAVHGQTPTAATLPGDGTIPTLLTHNFHADGGLIPPSPPHQHHRLGARPKTCPDLVHRVCIPNVPFGDGAPSWGPSVPAPEAVVSPQRKRQQPVQRAHIGHPIPVRIIHCAPGHASVNTWRSSCAMDEADLNPCIASW